MSVWARRTLVVLGIVVLISGGLLRGPFVVLAVILAGAMFVVAGRAPEDGLESRNLLVLHGEVWTRDVAGRPNRWDATAEVWEVVDPAPPDVIAAWDQRSSEEEQRRKPGRRVASALLVVVLILVGWALADPYANIPLVSQIVCSLKGASWLEGSAVLEVPPGCYERRPDERMSESGSDSVTQMDPTSEMDAALRDAATAEESYAVSNAGGYTPVLYDLVDEGSRFRGA